MAREIATGLAEPPFFSSERGDLIMWWRAVDAVYSMPHKHLHAAYELYYLWNGRRRYFIRDRFFDVEPGDIVLIRPFDMHRTHAIGSEPHERILVHWNFQSLALPLGQAEELRKALFKGDEPIFRLEGGARSQIEAGLAKLRAVPTQYHQFCSEAMTLEFTLLLTQLAELRCGSSIVTPSTAHQTVDQRHSRMARVAAWLSTHHRVETSVGDLAERFNISRAHLSREFKQVTGFSIGEFIRNARLKTAQAQLIETDDSVSAIALASGFGSMAQFGKVFRSLHSQSPSQFRKDHRHGLSPGKGVPS